MSVRPPSSRSIGVVAAFTLSCLVLLGGLWAAFDGPLPFRPAGYRVHVVLPGATELAPRTAVRIAGVEVGRVVAVTHDRSGRGRAELEIQDRAAPLPADTRATVRQKTVLGEPYVALSSGTPGGAVLSDGALLPAAQTQRAVALDEALGTFDAETRGAVRDAAARLAGTLDGQGPALAAATREAASFATAAGQVTERLAAQERALRSVSGDVVSLARTLARGDDDLRDGVRDAARVLRAGARRDDEVAAALRAVPALLAAAQGAGPASRRLAADVEPALRALLPAGDRLTRALRGVTEQARAVPSLVDATHRAATAAPDGVPAVRQLLTTGRDAAAALDPVMRDAGAASRHAGRYADDLAAIPALGLASSGGAQAGDDGRARHYLRSAPVLWSSVLADRRRRLPSSRANAYPAPRWLDGLERGLTSFSCGHLSNPVTVPPLLGGPPPCRRQTGGFPRLTRLPPGK